MNHRARGLRGAAMTGEAGEAPVVAVDLPARPERSELKGRQDGAGVLGDIRERLERAESLLMRPSALSAAQLISELEECCRLLAGAEPLWRGDAGRGQPLSREWRTSAEEWRRSLRRLEQLTAGASSFCQGWAVASGLAGGYTAAGAGESPTGGGFRMDSTG